MTDYRPPLTDLMFVLEHIADYETIASLPGFEHADLETVNGLLDEAGDFMAEVIAPTNRQGDTIGAKWQPDGSVVTPDSFKAAYRKLIDAGWGSLQFPEEFGGGGFPWTIGIALQEMLNSANTAFALNPLLTQGAIDALLHYGSDEQKRTFLPRMISGEWTGSMNLTEPHAGSDVGALTTRAVRRDDGTYRISGQKIFITYGEHDMADQIVHLVLARTPDAPAGTKGISCFIVPKHLVNDDGTLGERNGVRALSIEHKLGIHGSPTCVLEYDEATGYLIGEENIGMKIMFVMMNNARLSVGLQGLSLAERAYQDALAYAKERKQGKAIGAESDSPIIDHPDVRRMLMTQKAYIAALRRLMYTNSAQMDISRNHPDAAVRQRADEIVALLTPICKSFGTDIGSEMTSLALQVFGGMGYIEETGVAQYFRDVRITQIYEGTNGIQAADLVGRKLGLRGGAAVSEYLQQLRALDGDLAAAGAEFESIRAALSDNLGALEEATRWMLQNGQSDPNSALAGSSPYLRMWGLVLSAWLLAKGALVAAGTDDSANAETQLVLARFFAEQLLPAARGLLPAATAGARDLYALDEDRLIRR
ncbi:acyl-CoA dehydrogenase [Cryobacterium sp. BB736]|uniref:acyl-CoA dehydrogenase n=1 Tax=Cryobacterium sp. BB736 TaxID=2746963 RepID=UPI001877066B